MKIARITFVALLGSSLIFSCSKEKIENQNINHGSKKTAVTDYLDEAYSQGYSIGEVVYTSEESVTYGVYPVTPTGDSRARGYIAVDSTTGSLLYFADVDRDDFILSVEDISYGDSFTLEEIDNDPNYSATDQYDFINIIIIYNDDPLPSGRKFWGWDSPQDIGGCDNGFQTTVRQYHAFWIVVDYDYNEVKC